MGTKSGGRKTAKTIKSKYGKDYYVKLGKIGGSWKDPKKRPFAKNKELARIAGAKGGRISRRGKDHKPRKITSSLDSFHLQYEKASE